MSISRWSGQKTDASAHIKQSLADGQEKTIEALVANLRSIGVIRKNALKAMYSEVVAGTAVLSGNWESGTLKKGGA